LASSALIGAVRFECEVGAVSASKVDPASAIAMSGPRALMTVFMAALSDLTVFRSGNAEANEPQPAKTASRREEPPADRNDRSSPASLFDGCICIVCYWTGTALVNWTAAAFIVRVDFNGVCYFCNAPKSFFGRHGGGRFFRLDVADLLQMGAPFMKSLVIKRSVVVAGHKTSVSLEDAFWKGLKEIASERDLTLSELIGAIDSEREYGNLSSALRLFVLSFYRTQLSEIKEGRDGSGGESESSGAVRIRRMAQARH